MSNFWCVSVIFNPSGYNSRLDNYFLFRERLKLPLITVELSFNDKPHVIKDSVKLHSNSVMWQKERLINHAVSLLPPECENFAWLDADLLLPDGWDELAQESLKKHDFVQLFQNVAHLRKGEKSFGGKRQDTKIGIVWQAKTYGDNWINLRQHKMIRHAEPGFGWAAKRRNFSIYDRLICGSGDNFLADCLLDSFSLHHYMGKFTEAMKSDMERWRKLFGKKTVGYLPIEIYHLWHGDLKDRGYTTRDLIFPKHNYDPVTDLKITNNVWEWNSDKPQFHKEIIDYFNSRREDG